MKHLLFILLCAAVSCKPSAQQDNTSAPSEKSTVASYQNIDVATFNKASNEKGAVILDVRTPKEIAGGKISNAIELDFYDSDFADKVLAMDKTSDYYIYCKAGSRSAKAARLMIKNGFERVYNLEGGYTAWKKDSE